MGALLALENMLKKILLIQKKEIRLIPRFALHLECCYRFTCKDKIFLAKRDIFEPATKLCQQEDFDYTSFNWDVKENNIYDEKVSEFFETYKKDFVVKSIVISTFGDVNIYFENQFILEIFLDQSVAEEAYRFFDVSGETHLVVSEYGIL